MAPGVGFPPPSATQGERVDPLVVAPGPIVRAPWGKKKNVETAACARKREREKRERERERERERRERERERERPPRERERRERERERERERAKLILCAHNAEFDWLFVSRGLRRAGLPPPDLLRLCTLRLSRSLDPERQRSHRLGDLCLRYQVPLTRPHDAAADAAATAALLPLLLSRRPRSPTTPSSGRTSPAGRPPGRARPRQRSAGQHSRHGQLGTNVRAAQAGRAPRRSDFSSRSSGAPASGSKSTGSSTTRSSPSASR